MKFFSLQQNPAFSKLAVAFQYFPPTQFDGVRVLFGGLVCEFIHEGVFVSDPLH